MKFGLGYMEKPHKYETWLGVDVKTRKRKKLLKILDYNRGKNRCKS